MKDVTSRLAEKPLSVPDKLAHYTSASAEAYHTKVGIPITGERGRPRKPEIVIDDDLNYAIDNFPVRKNSGQYRPLNGYVAFKETGPLRPAGSQNIQPH
ncbi:MAG: hypothetical protein LBP22_00100 [Deltaproteobacteria bacterium]|jgi:hypothetical protein|nr:hypothetical protein [Deltaproteobacteria bacterium]